MGEQGGEARELGREVRELGGDARVRLTMDLKRRNMKKLKQNKVM